MFKNNNLNFKKLILNKSISVSSNVLFLNSLKNINSNNVNYIYKNINQINNYSTGSILRNTKRKSNFDRKIKVRHISKDDMEEVVDFQYKYHGLLKRNSIGKSDKAKLLKEDFNMDDKEIDDILSNEKEGYGENDGDFIEGSSQTKGKIYYSEKITYSTDTSKDNEFIKKSLGIGSSYSDKLEGDIEWKEIDPMKEPNYFDNENEDDTPKLADLKKKELEKKGLKERDGSYYADDYLITTEYESYFLSPDQPNNRKEKNLFRKLDDLKEAKEMSNKRGFKIKSNKNDPFYGQTIVQSRMSSRILEVLNESPLFSPVSFLNSGAHDTEFNFENDSEFDNNLKLLEAQKLIGSQVSSIGAAHASSNFSIGSDDLQIDKEDPILSKADIVLTHAEMSNDLRWVKIYWKRRSHSNVNNNTGSIGIGGNGKNITIDDFYKEDALYSIKQVKDEKVKSLLDSVSTNSAKQLVYDSFKPIIKDDSDLTNPINKSIFGSKIVTKQQSTYNYQNENDQNKNKIGFSNAFSLPNKKLELEISIRQSNNQEKEMINLINQEKEKEKEKIEKREKMISNILSNTDIDIEDYDDSNNNDSENKNIINNIQNQNIKQTNIDKEIMDDPLLQQLHLLSIQDNNQKQQQQQQLQQQVKEQKEKEQQLQEQQLQQQLEQIKQIQKQSNNINEDENEEEIKSNKNNKKSLKSKEDIEIRRQKKIRSLYHEVTDKDITHRLLKLKGRIRWIIGKRVQAKYVPDIMFIKDEDEIKDETTIDILDNLVPIEFKQLFVERVKSIEKTKSKLKNKYSSLFFDQQQQQEKQFEQDDDEDDEDDVEYNKDEEVDLYEILDSFPTLRAEPIVQKFLKLDSERLGKDEQNSRKIQMEKQKEKEEKEKEDLLQQEIDSYKDNNDTNVQQIFKQFNKEL